MGFKKTQNTSPQKHVSQEMADQNYVLKTMYY